MISISREVVAAQQLSLSRNPDATTYVEKRGLGIKLWLSIIDVSGRHMKTDVVAQPVMSSRFLIPFVGLMLGLNAFANDILLPAFYGIAADFGTPLERVQTLVPIFLIAAGCGQLVCGPLSDRFGRRPLLEGVAACGESL